MVIERDNYLNKLINAKHDGMVKIITGIRRCGKSYLLFRLFFAHLIASGVDEKHIIKIDLEDRHNKDLRNPDALMKYIDSHLNDSDVHYILLDEVQNVDNFTDVLNSYLKMSNVDIFVTGSNSKFLSSDVATEFRGRGREIKISPLTFTEFISVYNGSKEEALKDYMTFGGLPKLMSFNNDDGKVKYLQDIFKLTYLKDIQERYHIENSTELGELINVLASSIGSLTNPTKLHNTFKSINKSQISRVTIDNYLEILQEVFLVEKAIRYNIKGRKYIGTPSKFYFSDLGLRNARLNFRQLEPTHLMENLVYNELRHRGLLVDVGEVVKYEKDDQGKTVRRKLEVDFICNKGSRCCYIQSAYSLPTLEKQRQEKQSLINIKDSFDKFIITMDNVKRHQTDDGIIILNIFDFLMDINSLGM